MTWTRLSDGFADSPAVLALTDAAFRAHVTALIWCNKHLTDGAIPARAVRLFASGDAERVVGELVAAGLWADEGDSYRLDWSEQEAADAVRARAAASAERVRSYRERQRRHALGDHSLCDRCAIVLAERNGVSNGTTNGVRTPSPSRPVPSRPVGRDGDGDGTAAEAVEPSARATVSPTSPALEVMTRLRKAGAR